MLDWGHLRPFTSSSCQMRPQLSWHAAPPLWWDQSQVRGACLPVVVMLVFLPVVFFPPL